MKVSTIKKAFTIIMIIATIAVSLNMLLGGAVEATITIPPATAPTNAAFTGTVSSVLGIVSYLCYTAAVILLIMLGIKYMTQAPDGKAEIKKMAVTYVVGAVLVFASGIVLTLLSGLFKDTIKTT